MRRSFAAWLLPCLFLAVPTAHATTEDDVRLLQQQVHMLQKRIDQLEASMIRKKVKASETPPVPVAPPSAVVQAAPEPAPEPPNTTRSDANVFNPQISVILNGGYRSFSRNPSHFTVPGFALGDASGLGDRGLSINESELNFAANVDNLFYASSTLSMPPSGGINVEEAYFQTLALPAGLTVKAGRFFSGIGYLNQFHPHHDDFVDRSLAYRVFLNGTFAGDGVQVRWLAPTDTFLEFGSELLRGDRFPGGGAARGGAGAWDIFAHVGGDVGFSNSWRAGLSWLSTRPVGRNSFDNNGNLTGTFDGTSRLLIGDLIWKWAPNGNPFDTNLKFQTELFTQLEKGTFANAGSTAAAYNGRHWGGYAEMVYQFAHGWDIGVRHSQVFAVNNGTAVVPGGVLDTLGMRPRRTSLVLGYANSEFSRIRLQLSRDQSGPVADNQVALQYLMLIGAHGAHQF